MELATRIESFFAAGQPPWCGAHQSFHRLSPFHVGPACFPRRDFSFLARVYTEAMATRIAGVIPARLGSTRLARKVLRPLCGRPMVEWVYRAARDSQLMDPVLVATDSGEVAAICRDREIPYLMTSPDCASGSDRVREVASQEPADIYVNIQGDEPTLTPEFFPPLLALFERPEVQVATLAVACAAADVTNPNAVKVVTAADGKALYFSRAAIPYDRDSAGYSGYRKHLGIYAYRRAALERFASLEAGRLEQAERLEQLRLLENGIDVYVAPAPFDTIGVDTEADLQRAEAVLLSRRGGG